MIKFIRADETYIGKLRSIDFRVQNNSAEDEKETKPFLGVLFEIDNEINYYVPLSSPKPKHRRMKNSSDFHKILDSKGRLLSVLNFNRVEHDECFVSASLTPSAN